MKQQPPPAIGGATLVTKHSITQHSAEHQEKVSSFRIEDTQVDKEERFSAGKHAFRYRVLPPASNKLESKISL